MNFFQATTLKKNLGRSYPKKSQVAPYKNLGRFYRVPYKSLLRVQIKNGELTEYELSPSLRPLCNVGWCCYCVCALCVHVS